MSEPTREVPPTHRLIRGLEAMSRHNIEERARAREALMLSLSDNGLDALLKGLGQFRDGKPLPPKVRKMLEGILQENDWRKTHP